MDESDKIALVIAGAGIVTASLAALTGNLEAGDGFLAATVAAIVAGLTYYSAHTSRTT